MKYLFLFIIFTLILTLPLGGIELITGGRIALFSKWCRPFLMKAGKTLFGWIPKPVRRIIFVFFAIVFWIVATPLAIIWNYFMLWCALMVHTWENDSDELKPAERHRQNIISGGDYPGAVRPPSPPNVIFDVSASATKMTSLAKGVFKRNENPLESDDEDHSTIGGSVSTAV